MLPGFVRHRSAVFLLLPVLLINLFYRLDAAARWVRGGNGPICFLDELWYRYNAESLFSSTEYYSFHYPPLYPLVLAPSFLSQDNWYFWMLAINAVLSTLLLAATWLLARRFLPPLHSLLAVILVALLPYLHVYSRMVMSENLFALLVVGSVWSLLALRRNDFGMSYLFGLLLMASFATRHISLPLLPLFLSWWWWKTQRRLLPRRRSSWSVVGVLGGLLTILAPWLLYGRHWGIGPWETLLGSTGSSSVAPVLQLEMLPFWIGVYLAYLLVAAAPWLPWVLIRFVPRAPVRRGERHLGFLTAGTALLILAASIHHSWRIFYNYPEPQYVLGRYLLPVHPLILVMGMIALYHLSRTAAIPRLHFVLSTAVSLLLLFVARGLLVANWFFELAPGFANNPFNTPDTAALASGNRLVLWLLPAVAAVPLLTMAAPGRKGMRIVTVSALALLTLALSQISLAEIEKKVGPWGGVGLHAVRLAEAARKMEADPESNLAIVTDVPRVADRPERLKLRLQFFGLSEKTVVVTDSSGCLVEISDVVLHHSTKPAPPGVLLLDSYAAEGMTVRLWEEVNHSAVSRPCITNFGPQRVYLGQTFNPDGNGRSSIWIMARNLGEATQVDLDGHRIRPKQVNRNTVSFAVPEDVLATPGAKSLRLFDAVSGAVSNSMEFVVREESS